MPIEVTTPFEFFTDNQGNALEGGKVYIGEQGKDPVTNPIAVYFDSALKIATAQPLRTIVGFFANNGTPAKIYVESSPYSIAVYDKNGEFLYQDFEASGFDADSGAAGDNPSVSQFKEIQTATAGQQLIEFETITYKRGVNNLTVYVDGAYQTEGVDYNETSVNSITFNASFAGGERIVSVTNSTVTTDYPAENFFLSKEQTASSNGQAIFPTGWADVSNNPNAVYVYINNILQDGNYSINTSNELVFDGSTAAEIVIGDVILARSNAVYSKNDGSLQLDNYSIACSDETTALSVTPEIVTFRAPYGMWVTGIRASLTDPSTAGGLEIDVNINGVSMLSTKITIDQDETTSDDAAVPPVISTQQVFAGDEFTVDLDIAGTGATGLKLYVIGIPEATEAPQGTTAASIAYSNTLSGLTADDVQAAIDEIVASGAAGSQLMHVRDEKATNVDAGTSSAGNNTRVLNTVETNQIAGASLGSNQITLPAGTYRARCSAPAHRPNATKLGLYDTTGSAYVINGMSMYSDAGALTSVAPVAQGQFTLGVSSVLELRHYIQTGLATFGLGVATNDGEVEVYAEVFIEKVA